MSNEIERDIPFKIKPSLQNQQIADGVDIELDTDTFDGNLTSSVGDVQALAQAIDDLTIAGGMVTIDNTGFQVIDTVDDAQEVASELDRLFGIVQAGGSLPTPRFEGAFIPFTDSTTITGTNFDTYAGRIALYARSDDARVSFILPSDAVITDQGVATDEAVEFTVLNQAGTGRFDSGIAPTNTVVIDVPGANNIRRGSATGPLLNFIEAHQNDLVTLTQSARGQPWVATRVTLSTAALLLPSGIFRLQVGTLVSLNPALNFIAGLPPGVTPQAGDAYQVSTGNENFGGYGVETGDVIVALQDSPSLIVSETNDDWLVIRNATNDIISLAEVHFLNATNEVDTFEDDRLADNTNISDVRLWLSPFILDHAPFINPSTDPNNPQSGETGEYIGGDEDDSDDYEFTADVAAISRFTGEAGSSIAPGAFMYVDIDGADSTNAELLDTVYVVIRDRDGAEIARHKLTGTDADFRAITLTGSGDTYYVFDNVGAADNFSSISYHQGWTIDVVARRTIRSFTLDDAINVLGGIPDNSITIEKLEPNAQALLQSDHSLTDAQTAAVDGLTTGGTPTAWTAGTLYVKDNDASPDNRESHYFNVGQQNGILAEHGRTRSVTFVVPNFVTVTQLQRTDDTSIKNAVTSIGTLTITADDGTSFTGHGFTSSLPASTFDVNNPVGDSWQVDGTAANLELTGAVDSFKVGLVNMRQEVIDRFTPHADPLPDVLQTLATDLTVTQRTSTNWQEIPAPSNTPELTRQFAFGWDENRRSFTDNYFEDLTGIDTLGFAGNNVFFYSDPNDVNNRNFPGAQSYILNDNVRIRNTVGGAEPISDSFRKIIGFDYALQEDLSSGADLSMLRIGGSGTTPLLGLHHEEGLYLNIGRGDGGQRTRTVTTSLTGVGGYLEYPFGSVGGLATLGEAEFLAPNTNLEGTSYPVTIRVNIRLDDNGDDEGTFTHEYVITDSATDQAETTFTATHTLNGSPRTFTWAIRYEHNHNHATFGQQDIVFIRDVTAETNPALTDYVSMEYDRTVTWNASSTYARFPVNAGSGHDDFGLFDPSRYNTEHVRERNRVLLAFRPYDLTDTSSDPEMAVHIIVDGEKEGSSSNGYLIRLHRPANEFDFTDINFGNTATAVSHIQCYDYDSGHLFGEDTLLDYYNAADRWLGRFRHPTETTDTFQFAALAQFTGVIGGNDVRATMVADAGATDGYRWKFTEI